MFETDEVMGLLMMLTGVPADIPADMLSALLAGALLIVAALEPSLHRPRPTRAKENPMSWQTHHRRNEILNDTLRRARRHSRIAFADIPGAAEVFGTEEALLLALQRKWSTHLAARLDQAVEDAAGGGPPVHRAWDRLAAEQPALRALLDAGRSRYDTLRAAYRADRHMIAVHAALAGEDVPLAAA